MYTPSKPTKTTLSLNQTYVAESIEKKVFRMVNNKEPIEDPNTQIAYTERKDGVNQNITYELIDSN